MFDSIFTVKVGIRRCGHAVWDFGNRCRDIVDATERPVQLCVQFQVCPRIGR